MKFPYGIANFHQIITDDYFYQDRTRFIPMLEYEGINLLFLRPRRFGKSLLLSTLEHYYDVNRADEFETLFGGLEICFATQYKDFDTLRDSISVRFGLRNGLINAESIQTQTSEV